MNSHLKLALFGAASLALAVALGSRIGRPEPVIIAVAQADDFSDVWRDAAVPVALKTASLADTTPKLIVTETILPPLIAQPEELTPKLRRKLIHVRHKDVCERHGMHKVYRGRGWRCKH